MKAATNNLRKIITQYNEGVLVMAGTLPNKLELKDVVQTDADIYKTLEREVSKTIVCIEENRCTLYARSSSTLFFEYWYYVILI